MRYQRILILILIGWFLILSMGHYFNQRPLWNDEQCVENNIIQQKSRDLFTKPLLSDQAFPRLYLWSIQQFSKPFNQNLLALRFFSLLAMLGAFFIWFSIARRVLGESWGLILFIGSWCASMPLVYYAAELKPYSMDVLVCGLIVLFLLEQNKIRKDLNFYRAILFLMPLLCWGSYPAIFLLLLPLCNLVRDCFDDQRNLPDLFIYVVGCTLALGIVYWIDYRVSIHHLLEVYWHDYFISVHSFKDFLKTFGKGMNNLLSRRFAEDPKWVKIPSRIFIGLGVGYMLFSFGNQFKKDGFALRSIISISCAMLILQLMLAILRIYPLGVPRMTLFFSPVLFLVTIMAMEGIYKWRKIAGIILQGIFAAYLIFVSAGIAWNVFIKRDLGAESALYDH